MTSQALFFEPWVGRDYARLKQQQFEEQGAVLEPSVWAHPFHVLGESHYGDQTEYEPNFTRSLVEKCGHSSTYGKCSAFFAKVLKIVQADEHPELTREQHWQKLAFSNYIQDLMQGPRVAPSAEQWERGREAFPEQLKATTPGTLLVLGQRLWKNLPRDFGFQVSKLEAMSGLVTVEEAWAYVYEVNGVKRLSLAVYVIHPSAGGGAFKWRIAAERARTVAVYHSNIAVSEQFDRCEPLRLD